MTAPCARRRRPPGRRPVHDPDLLARLQALLLVLPALRPGQHPPRPAAGQQRRHGHARAPASRRTRTRTWRSSPGCCAGSLVHQDSTGHSGVIYPGLAQRMSAGTGILHSEKNDSWRLHDSEPHTRPGALRADVGAARRAGRRPRLRAAGDRRRAAARRPGAGRLRHGPQHDGASAIRIRNRHAALHAARLAPRRQVDHARRAVRAPVRAARHGDPGGRRPARQGDAVRLTATGGQRVTADEPAEILVWEMHATVA